MQHRLGLVGRPRVYRFAVSPALRGSERRRIAGGGRCSRFFCSYFSCLESTRRFPRVVPNLAFVLHPTKTFVASNTSCGRDGCAEMNMSPSWMGGRGS